MALKDLMNKAQEVTASASDAASKFLDEFNEALPTMRALGFTVRDLRIGMGLLPEIGAKLVASTDTMDPKKIDELIKKQQERKTLVALLKALQAAYNIKQQLADVSFKGVEIDVALGLPPHINVGFLGNTSGSVAVPLASAAQALVA